MVDRVKINSRFTKGKSGNPKGRPQGSRHQVTELLEMMGQAVAPQIMHRVIHEALFNNDMRAIEMILKRIWPERKGVVEFQIPPLNGPADLPLVMNALIKAVTAGQLAPSEASDIAAMVETTRSSHETSILERRMNAVEEILKLRKANNAKV